MKDALERQILEDIAGAIGFLCDEISGYKSSSDKKELAEAVKALAEAYKLVKRGALK